MGAKAEKFRLVGETAGPSTPVGMTKGRVVMARSKSDEKANRRSLHSGRDDKG